MQNAQYQAKKEKKTADFVVDFLKQVKLTIVTKFQQENPPFFFSVIRQLQLTVTKIADTRYQCFTLDTLRQRL